MAKKQIEIEILAKGKPAERSIDKVSKKTKALATTTQKSGAMMKASWAKVGLAVAGVTVALKKASDAHAIQLKAELALTTALRLNAKAGEHTIDMWKKYASELQSVTIFGDEMTLQQIAMLKTMGLTDVQTKELIETAMDYATAFGKDVPSAVRELTMTLSGQLGTIKRTIPSIGDYTKEQLKAGDAIKDVRKLMDGQAKALADTPWGKTRQQVNLFGDDMEVIGQKFLEFASESGGLTLVKNIFEGLSISIRFAHAGIVDISRDIKELLEGLGVWEEKIEEKNKKTDKEITQQEQLAKLKLLQKDILRDMSILEGSALEAAKKQLAAVEKQIAQSEFKIINHEREKVVLIDLTTETEKFTKAIEENIVKEKELNEVGKDVTTSIGDYFSNMVLGVKTSFADMARSILANLVRVRMETLATKMLTGVSFFTLHTGGEVKHTGGEVKHTGGEVKHTGGAIGTTKIPSFHTGVRSDERLAKLQVGEAVINRGGAVKNKASIEAMNKGYSVGGNGGQVTTAEINFNVQAIDAASFNSYLINNRSTIEGIINASLTTNGSVRRTIKQVV